MDDVSRLARPEVFSLMEYVPGKPIAEVERELGINNIIKLASNENQLGISPLALAAIKSGLHDLHIYPDNNCHSLKARLAKHYGLRSENFVIGGNGSDEVLLIVAQTFVNRKDQVITAASTFSGYKLSAGIMGADVIEVPLIDYKFDLGETIAAINEKTKLIYLCSPNNPTGSILPKKELEHFMDQVPENVIVVFDEAYGEYVETGDFVSGISYLNKKSNVIVLKTFSKIYGLAALRIGYAITDPKIAALLNRTRMPFSVNNLAQIAAAAALNDQEHVNNSRELNRVGKDYLYQNIAELGLTYVPSEANFVFIDLKRDAGEIYDKMLSQGVIIRKADSFKYPTHIRVTIGTIEQNQRMIKALKLALGK